MKKNTKMFRCMDGIVTQRDSKDEQHFFFKSFHQSMNLDCRNNWTFSTCKTCT